MVHDTSYSMISWAQHMLETSMAKSLLFNDNHK